MKKIFFLGLAMLVTISAYAQNTRSPLEGAWQMAYGTWLKPPVAFPDQVKGGQLKIWSERYYTCVGHFERDTVIWNNYVGGRYLLNGSRYEEELTYFPNKSMIGQKSRILIEIRNDTLIQKWPVDENWNLAKSFRIEKYIRLDNK